jgi:O-antigen/teichoic acid export membrane protein
VLTREIARDRSKDGRYLCAINGIKLVSALITYFSLFIIVQLLGYSEEVKTLIFLSGIIMVVDAFNVSFYAVFRGIQVFTYEAIGIIVGQVILLIIGLTTIFLHLPFYFLIIAVLAASIFNAIFSTILIRKKLGIAVLPSFDRFTVRELLPIALPFMITAILMRIYGYIDIVLLYQWVGAREVSYYIAAYKIPFALSFIPAALGSALFPAFSHYFIIKDREKIIQTLRYSISALMMLVLPIVLGGILLSSKLILFIYSDKYIDSIIPLQILLFSLIFVFISYPLGALLNACNRQKQNTIMISITLMTNLIANVILIPRFQYIGSSIAMVTSSFVLVFGSLISSTPIIHVSQAFPARIYTRLILSLIPMALFVWFFREFLFFGWIIFGSAVIYCIILRVFGLLTAEEIGFMKNIFQRKTSSQQ